MGLGFISSRVLGFGILYLNEDSDVPLLYAASEHESLEHSLPKVYSYSPGA